MKLDARNMLRQAADTLDAMHRQQPHPFAGAPAFSLRELADNLDELGRKPEQYEEFAALYCHPTQQDNSNDR